MKKIRLFFASHGPLLIALMLAAGVLAVSEYSNWRVERAFAQLERSVTIRLTLAELRRQILGAETGQRGYLITGQEDYAKPYYAALATVHKILESLRQHYDAGNRASVEFETLSVLVQRRMDRLAATFQLRVQGDEAGWRAALGTNIGRDQMVLIDDHLARLLDAERAQMSMAENFIAQAVLLGRIGIAAVTALTVLLFVLYLRQTARLTEAHRQHEEILQSERDQLEITVNQRTQQLSQLASYLVTAREDERARIARELHDELGALFTTAKLDVARLRSRLAAMTPEITERLTHLGYLIGGTVHGAADDEKHAAGVQTFRFGTQRLRSGLAVDDAFYGGEIKHAFVHGLPHPHLFNQPRIRISTQPRRLRHGKVAVLRNDLITEWRLGEITVVALNRNLARARRANVNRRQ